MKVTVSVWLRLALLAAMLWAGNAALAQPWPGERLRKPAPFPPGGPGMARPGQPAPGIGVPQAAGPISEVAQDPLGAWQRSRNYEAARRHGMRVFAAPQFGSFFALHLPPGFAAAPVKRLIVAVPGTGGTPYAEIQDEAPYAARFGHAVLALHTQPGPDRSLTPVQVRAFAAEAIGWLREHEGLQFRGIAWLGFSRGGAAAFEAALADRRSGQPLFSLMISHSGFSGAEAPFRRLLGEERGQPLAGLPFAFYCGMQDEEWGERQCADMDRLRTLIESLGAGPVRVIREPAGGHGGYRRNPAHHEGVLRWFAELVP